MATNKESFLGGDKNWEEKSSDAGSENSLLVQEEEDSSSQQRHEPLRSPRISTIVRGGEKELNKMIRAVNSHGVNKRTYELEAFLQDEMSRESKFLALSSKNQNGLTALFWVIRNRVHCSIIQKMLDIGGKELVMQASPLGENSLHYAALCGSSYDVFRTLINVAGKEALLQQDRLGNTPLHYAYCWVVSNRTKAYLTEVGGKDVLLTKNHKNQVPFLGSSFKKIPNQRRSSLEKSLLDNCGDDCNIMRHTYAQELHDMTLIELIMLNQLQEAEKRLNDANLDSEKLLYQVGGTSRCLNCLMMAIWFHGNASPSFKPDLLSLIKHMVEAGGKNLVLMENNSGSNAVHYAAFNQLPLEVIQLLVETAGYDVIHMQNTGWGNTPLHDACLQEAPAEVIEYLVENQEGMKALVIANHDNKTPLDLLLNADAPSDSRISALQRGWYERDKNFAQVMTNDLLMKALLWEFGKDDDAHLISNYFIKAILNQLFVKHRYRIIVMMDFYVQIAIAAVYLVLSCDELYMRSGSASSTMKGTSCVDNTMVGVIILCLCSTYLIGREMVQIFASKIERYVRDYNNYVQLCQITLVIWSAVLLLAASDEAGDEASRSVSDDKKFRSVMIAATSVSWLELLFVIGKLNFSVSVFTSAFCKIIVELFPFALTSVLVIVAFAQMYYISGVGHCPEEMLGTETSSGEPYPSNFSCSKRGSYFQAFTMLLTSDFAFLSWEDIKENDVEFLQIVVSLFFALVVGILLLNILIGVVSSVFEEVKAKSAIAFWSTRLAFMVEISIIRDAVDADDIDFLNLVSSTSQERHTGIRSDRRDNERIPLVGRKSFAQYDDDWMRTKCPDADMEAFFKWWYYPWKNKRPSIGTRLGYFYRYASLSEIMFPGDIFINVLFGFKYNYQWQCRVKKPFPIAISYAHFLIGIIVTMVVFLLGLFSFGLLWPNEMKNYLFCGPVEDVVERTENAALDNLTKEIDDMKLQNSELKNRVGETQKQIATMQEQNDEILTMLTRMQKDNSFARD